MEHDDIRQVLRRSRLGSDGEPHLRISNSIVKPSLINDNGNQFFFWPNYHYHGNTVPETTTAFCPRVDEEHIQSITQQEQKTVSR